VPGGGGGGGGEYRRDMHYTMDARFSRLISLNCRRSAVPAGYCPGYRSRKSNLRKYIRTL